ncbi:MAG: aminotransferase class I/II-fold pyridoxal phosphate-dependent enzyme [Oscillospiraceae bacterium]|jgi:DNA-binding transcriptional MocR family regulator|nr:aminotransferase class I/II-fold pyridoxal phosphate-dependent enzyme [Oscillospiraceae bacterium]MBQ2144715.1 aminotransferase class I/II-fold pyridoxal phosphate-dependent enzyme [Oscillospiraceae bacterium]MBQ2203738.1 aminotransferase class I/II-fold pyridoxal phosphate-dependent enzyme [Oscillospiraceae bacterium]MBQ2328380.1 aminotransferase class I/II-fold pyridoxal phosphate-dependent enzyme [Oscillospiraceae bacterium]MBQ4301995.1 aminotransferase class I/II-fold pyridoxal phosphate
MNAYEQMTKAEREAELKKVRAEFDALCAKKLSLNMARGKPGAHQLDLSTDMLTIVNDPAQCKIDGIDARNYGELAGLPSAKKLFAEILGVTPEQCFIGGSASLQLMYDVIAKAYTHGLRHSPKPWAREDHIKWLCPAPGYDRHFNVTKSFGMELITVPMLDDGPDMDMVEKLVKDPTVKGIWCVPKYSNPEGVIYSEETVRRFAALKPAAPDFTIMWDNAYCVHEFEGEFVPFPDIISLCAEQGRPDMAWEFASTSKITFPGAGISVLASSLDNLAYYKSLATFQIISYDKMNQLRHVLFLKDKAHTLDFMKKHAEVLRPRFHCVLEVLDREIAPLGLAEWKHPKGGYFVSVNTIPGLATRTWELCKQAGVTMTKAGATYPNGFDPNDSNIRIAPSFPELDELRQAMEIFCTCLKLAALEQLSA